jgi:hypothetical protein
VDDAQPAAGEARQLRLFGGDGRGSVGAAPPLRLAEAVDAYLTFQASIGRSQHTLRATRVDLGGLVRHLADPCRPALRPGRGRRGRPGVRPTRSCARAGSSTTSPWPSSWT